MGSRVSKQKYTRLNLNGVRQSQIIFLNMLIIYQKIYDVYRNGPLIDFTHFFSALREKGKDLYFKIPIEDWDSLLQYREIYLTVRQRLVPNLSSKVFSALRAIELFKINKDFSEKDIQDILLWFDKNLIRKNDGVFCYRDIESALFKELVPHLVIYDDFPGDCIICMNSPKTIVFLSCGHYSCCKNCAYSVSACPSCRTPITERKLRTGCAMK